MKQKRHSVDQIIAKLRKANVELDKTVAPSNYVTDAVFGTTVLASDESPQN